MCEIVVGASFRKIKLGLALPVLVGFQFELGVPNNITLNILNVYSQHWRSSNMYKHVSLDICQKKCCNGLFS